MTVLSFAFIIFAIVACEMAYTSDLAWFNQYVVYVLSAHLAVIWGLYLYDPLV
jgi:hypothetical protein